jgi:hypothetical protein
MPFPPDLARMVGFVARNGKPVGTCFLVRIRSIEFPYRPYWDHAYLVTAAHVAPPDGSDTEIWMSTSSGELVRDFIPHWHYPEGDDIAVAPFVSAEDSLDWSALQLYKYATSSMGIYGAHLGAPVHYVGLLGPVASMADRGQPMVRTANLGAMDVEHVEYTGQGGGWWSARLAHLIDCRSYGGFSGSPVFLSAEYTGPLVDAIPAAWKQQLSEDETLRSHEFGGLWHFAALFGMLVGYGRDAGVGIVLPIELISLALDMEELVEKRKEDEAARYERERQKGLIAEHNDD